MNWDWAQTQYHMVLKALPHESQRLPTISGCGSSPWRQEAKEHCILTPNITLSGQIALASQQSSWHLLEASILTNISFK